MDGRREEEMKLKSLLCFSEEETPTDCESILKKRPLKGVVFSNPINIWSVLVWQL